MVCEIHSPFDSDFAVGYFFMLSSIGHVFHTSYQPGLNHMILHPRKYTQRSHFVVYYCIWVERFCHMMTSSNRNTFRVTGTLCGEFTGHRWIPLTKSSEADHWCTLICAWTNGWVNNRDTGDLRRYCAHYDVTIMHICHHCPSDSEAIVQIIYKYVSETIIKT